jgi:hypothetical protein
MIRRSSVEASVVDGPEERDHANFSGVRPVNMGVRGLRDVPIVGPVSSGAYRGSHACVDLHTTRAQLARPAGFLRACAKEDSVAGRE